MDSSTNLVVEAGLFNDLISVALDEYLVNCKKDADRYIVPLTVQCYGSTQTTEACTNNDNIQWHFEFE